MEVGIRVTPLPPGVTTASLHSRAVPAPVPVPFHFGAPPDRYLSLSPGLLSLPVPSRPVPHPQRPRTPRTVPISRLPVPTVWLPGPVLLLALCLSYV